MSATEHSHLHEAREAEVEAEQLAAHYSFLARKAAGETEPGITTDQVRKLFKLDNE